MFRRLFSFSLFIILLLLVLTKIQPVKAVINGARVTKDDMVGKAIAFIDTGVGNYRNYRYCTGFLLNRWNVMTLSTCCLR